MLTKPAVGKEAADTPRGARADPERGQPSPTPELSEISACHTLPHYEYLNNVNDPLKVDHLEIPRGLRNTSHTHTTVFLKARRSPQGKCNTNIIYNQIS